MSRELSVEEIKGFVKELQSRVTDRGTKDSDYEKYEEFGRLALRAKAAEQRAGELEAALKYYAFDCQCGGKGYTVEGSGPDTWEQVQCLAADHTIAQQALTKFKSTPALGEGEPENEAPNPTKEF